MEARARAAAEHGLRDEGELHAVREKPGDHVRLQSLHRDGGGEALLLHGDIVGRAMHTGGRRLGRGCSRASERRGQEGPAWALSATHPTRVTRSDAETRPRARSGMPLAARSRSVAATSRLGATV